MQQALKPEKLAAEPDLYPEIEAFATGMLAVDGLHKIYWEQSGNPRGEPVVFLHGGPGAGIEPGPPALLRPRLITGS